MERDNSDHPYPELYEDLRCMVGERGIYDALIDVASDDPVTVKVRERLMQEGLIMFDEGGRLVSDAFTGEMSLTRPGYVVDMTIMRWVVNLREQLGIPIERKS